MAALPHDLAERLLDGSPDAILICDPVGTVRYWNAAAERIFGFAATEALGVSMNLIIPDRLRARHWAAWEATMRTGITRYGGGQLLAVAGAPQGWPANLDRVLHSAREGRRRPDRVGSGDHPGCDGALSPR
jgi:PAS domain-containing protein